jgi:hypothetical protein
MVNTMFASLDQAMLTMAAAVLAAAAGFVGAVISRAVPTGLAPANDNWPIETRLRRRRRRV